MRQLLCGSYIKIWNLANHMKKKWNKEDQSLSFQFFINKISMLICYVLCFHVVCKKSTFNIWHMCVNRKAFSASFLYWVDFKTSVLPRFASYRIKTFVFKQSSIIFGLAWLKFMVVSPFILVAAQWSAMTLFSVKIFYYLLLLVNEESTNPN